MRRVEARQSVIVHEGTGLQTLVMLEEFRLRVGPEILYVKWV